MSPIKAYMAGATIHSLTIGRRGDNSRSRRDLFVALVFVAMHTALGGQLLLARDETSEGLLDEIEAGVDANMALIQRGVAKYRAVVTTYPDYRRRGSTGSKRRRRVPVVDDGKPSGPYASETTVYFDYPCLRFDWHGQRRNAAGGVRETTEWTIFNHEYRIESSKSSSAYARIEPIKGGVEAWETIHPRQQAMPNWGYPLGASKLSAVRANRKVKLVAAYEPDGLIRLTMLAPVGNHSFWLSPNEGYSIVRVKIWRAGEDDSQPPYQVHEAAFRKTSNGAFVLEQRVSHQMLNGPDGKLTPSRDEEVRLLEIEMRDSIDPELFTLDGLSLPRGAKIIDTVHGRDYEYATAAVAESEIIPPEPRGAVAVWRWLTPAYVLVGAALAGALVWRIRRAGAARRRGNAPTNDP